MMRSSYASLPPSCFILQLIYYKIRQEGESRSRRLGLGLGLHKDGNNRTYGKYMIMRMRSKDLVEVKLRV
jgi:hypothetical protein